MCKKLAYLTSIILLLGISGAGRAADYYVSPSGNDANSGASPEQAWQTIDKVNTVTFGAGDSIFFEGGVIFTGGLEFDAKDAGTSSNPVTVGSYGMGRATINSGKKHGLYARNT